MQHLDEGTLQAWVDRARSGLDPSKVAEIEQHLAACVSCTSRAESLAAVGLRAHGLLSMGRDEHAPRVSFQDVARRSHGSRTRERLRMRRLRTMWAASVIVAVGLGWVSNNLYRASGSAESVLRTAVPAAGTSLSAGGTPVQSTAPSPANVASNAAPLGAGAAGVSTAAAPGTDPDGLVVRGFVADEGGRPVPSAQVYVEALAVGVLTQPNGRYDLRLPTEPDSFELTVQRIGFRQQTREISGSEGDYVAADFRLREEALALDEILVTGESDGMPTRSIGNMTTDRRATPFVWRPASSVTAEGNVGSALWTLSGLDVLTLEVAYGDNPNERHVARIRQDLGGGSTLVLVQGRTDGRRTRWPVQSMGAVQSTWRGEMLITATAPVSADSLRTLLTQLR